MIAYRKRHPIIRKKLPDAVCGMAAIHTHDIIADRTEIPKDARTFGVCFAGYDCERGADDITYMVVNAYWEDVTVTLPNPRNAGTWFLSVNTYGDEQDRYFYPEDKEIRIDGVFVMRPRSVAVFTIKRDSV